MLWDNPSCKELSLIGVPKAVTGNKVDSFQTVFLVEFVPLLDISLPPIYIYIYIYIYMYI